METLFVKDQFQELFNIECSIKPSVIDELNDIEFRDVKYDLQGFLRQKSTILIGTPLSIPISSIIKASPKFQAPIGIQALLAKSKFCLVQVPISFIAANDCRFASVFVEFRLYFKSLQKNDKESQPIVYDLYPQKVKNQVNISRKFELTPDIKLSFGAANMEASLVNIGSSKDFISYNCHVEAFGLRSKDFGWKFSHSEHNSISGIYNLFFITQTPLEAKTAARVSIKASVESLVGVWPIKDLPLSTTFRKSGRTDVTPIIEIC